MNKDAPATVDNAAEPEKASEPVNPSSPPEAAKQSEPVANAADAGGDTGATKNASAPAKAKEELTDEEIKHLPIRQYLEQTVVGVIMQGLQQICRKRPDDPVSFMSEFLVRNNPKKRKAEEAAGEEAGVKTEAPMEDKPVVAPAAAPVE